MRTIDCPQCGAPLALSVESALEARRCERCQHAFALPDSIRSSLEESRAIIERSADGDRQLESKERESVASVASASLLSRMWLAATLVPPTLIALLWAAMLARQGSIDLLLLAFGALPLALSIVLAVLSRRSVTERRARLAEACAAEIQPGPSQLVCCFLCGATLEAAGNSVARCRYCRADNVVDPVVVRRAHERREHARSQSTAALLTHLAAVRRALRTSALISAVSVVSGPVLSLIALVVVTFALDAREVALHPFEYATVTRGNATCIAKVTRYSDHVRLSYGGIAGLTPEDRPSSDSLAMTSIQSWVGRRVRVGPEASEAHTVQRAFGTAAGSNNVSLDNGAVRTLEGLCVAE